MLTVFSSALLLVACIPASVLAETVDSDMGPAAFLFPPDRAYSASLDNTAPCGSVAQVGNRTDFPLTGGFVSLVDQEEAFNVQVAISFNDSKEYHGDLPSCVNEAQRNHMSTPNIPFTPDPTGLSEFEVLVAASSLKELNEGHTCVAIPNAPSNLTVGDVATLQVVYQSVWDDSTANQTFYACADIRYILDADFTKNDYCFNATNGDATTGSGTDSTATPTSTTGSGSDNNGSSPDSSGSGSSHKSVSKGTIAGAVVGSVVGAALVAGLVLYAYRLGAKHQRVKMMRTHMNTMALDDMNKPVSGSQVSH